MPCMRLKDVADYLNVSETTVRAWALREEDPLPRFRLPGLRRWKYDRAAVDAWIERQARKCA